MSRNQKFFPLNPTLKIDNWDSFLFRDMQLLQLLVELVLCQLIPRKKYFVYIFNMYLFTYIFQLFVYIFSAICFHFFAGGVLFPGTDHIDQWNKIIGKLSWKKNPRIFKWNFCIYGLKIDFFSQSNSELQLQISWNVYNLQCAIMLKIVQDMQVCLHFLTVIVYIFLSICLLLFSRLFIWTIISRCTFSSRIYRFKSTKR